MHSEPLEHEIGIVKAVKQYLVSIEGLPSAHVHDVVKRDDGARALVTSLRHDAVEAMMLDQCDVAPGQTFLLQQQTPQLYFGPQLFGRVVNALCDPVDGKGALPPKNAHLELDRSAGVVAERALVTEQLETGYSMTDTVLPIGRGQRQLLMGPVQSGVEVFATEVMKQQAAVHGVNIYVIVGKQPAYIERVARDLFSADGADRTILVVSGAYDGTPLNTITPAVGVSLAEHFGRQGEHVLLVVDDLYAHAKYVREVSLQEGQLPGRESYPGDIFYRQAQLIERAGSFKDAGTITFLPMLQTDMEGYADLITTNIMGTTDGHLAFSSALYAQGAFPSIVDDESVTRVGRHTQYVVQKQLSTAIITALSQAKAQERIAQFGTDVSGSTAEAIRIGAMLRTLLRQSEGDRLDRCVQATLLSLPFTTFAQDKDASFFDVYRTQLVHALEHDAACKPVVHKVETAPDLGTFLEALEGIVSHITKACRS